MIELNLAEQSDLILNSECLNVICKDLENNKIDMSDINMIKEIAGTLMCIYINHKGDE